MHLPYLTGLHISTCKGFDFPSVFNVISGCHHLKRVFSNLVGSCITCAASDGLTIGLGQDLTRVRETLNRSPSMPRRTRRRFARNGQTFPLKSFLSIFSLFKSTSEVLDLTDGPGHTCSPPRVLRAYRHRHAKTLRRVVLIRATYPTAALQLVCKACRQLESPRHSSSVVRRSGM